MGIQIEMDLQEKEDLIQPKADRRPRQTRQNRKRD